MKYCPNCGSGVDASDTYCYECGEDLSHKGAEASETEEAEEAEEVPGDEVDVEEEGNESQGGIDDLTNIEAVGETKAKALRDAGYETVDDLREATQEEISNVEKIGEALSARIKSNVDRMDIEEEGDSSETESRGENREVKQEEKDIDTGDSNGDEESDEKVSGTSRYPVLSVFAAVMLFWSAFWSINNSGSPLIDSTIFALAGFLIIPRVRNSAVIEITETAGTDITSRPALWSLLRYSVSVLYIILVSAAILLIIGGAANDPNMSPWAGVGSILIAFVIAVVAVALSPPIENNEPVIERSGESGDFKNDPSS